VPARTVRSSTFSRRTVFHSCSQGSRGMQAKPIGRCTAVELAVRLRLLGTWQPISQAHSHAPRPARSQNHGAAPERFEILNIHAEPVNKATVKVHLHTNRSPSLLVFPHRCAVVVSFWMCSTGLLAQRREGSGDVGYSRRPVRILLYSLMHGVSHWQRMKGWFF
jgi:hypothetical protein